MLSIVCLLAAALAAENAPAPPVQVGGVFPALTVFAPGAGSTSETGIGALIPWADRLWAIGYVAHIRGEGIGLYEIRDDMTMRLHPEAVTGTFANRMVHWETKQAVIGPHIIAADGTVRTVEALKGHRLTATARHLKHPETMAYFLTMEGLLFETDLNTLETRQRADLVKELGIEGLNTCLITSHTEMFKAQLRLAHEKKIEERSSR